MLGGPMQWHTLIMPKFGPALHFSRS